MIILAKVHSGAANMDRYRFSFFARRLAVLTGRPAAFLLACAAILAWLLCGPLFGYSDTWQLVINTSTTIVTFLMVFLIQNTQNRDTEAMQLKLDELIRATQGAHNALLDLEEVDDQRVEQYKRSYRKLASAARKKLENGALDTDSPEVKEFKRL